MLRAEQRGGNLTLHEHCCQTCPTTCSLQETLDRKFFCFLGIYLFVCLGLGHSTWNLSSLTRDQTCVPGIGRKILNHQTTRGSPDRKFLKGICYGRKYLPTKYILSKCQVGKCQKSHFFCYETYLINQWE